MIPGIRGAYICLNIAIRLGMQVIHALRLLCMLFSDCTTSQFYNL